MLHPSGGETLDVETQSTNDITCTCCSNTYILADPDELYANDPPCL